MTDYIKREDAKELFEMLLEQYHDTGVEVIKHTAAIAPKEFHISEIADFNFVIDRWKKDFSNIQSADVAPVRHGQFVPFEDVFMDTCWECSECGLKFYLADGGTPKENSYNYCPNCGTRMDGEENDG